jgi:hypothetical protein
VSGPNRTPPPERKIDRNRFVGPTDRNLEDKVRVIEDQIVDSAERTVERVIENLIGDEINFGDYIDQRVRNEISSTVINTVTNIFADFDGFAGTPMFRQPPGFWYASQTYDPNWPFPAGVGHTIVRPNSIYYQPITFYEPGVITRAALGYKDDYSSSLVQVGLFEPDADGLPGQCIGLTESVEAEQADPSESKSIMHLSIIAVVEPGMYWIGVRFEGEGPDMYGYVPTSSETGLSGWERSGEIIGDFVETSPGFGSENLQFNGYTTHFPVFARLTSDTWGGLGDDVPLPFELNELAQPPTTYVRDSLTGGEGPSPAHLQPLVLLYKFS